MDATARSKKCIDSIKVAECADDVLKNDLKVDNIRGKAPKVKGVEDIYYKDSSDNLIAGCYLKKYIL